MKKNVLVALVGLFLLSATLSAQQINTDSLSLVSKISSDQLKLGKLLNTVDQKTRDKQDAATKAQSSADENKVAADRLSNAPQDKKLAKQADNKASDARSDAKKARIANDNLDNLNKDILDLQDKIAKNQRSLDKYTHVNMPAAFLMPGHTPVASPDSTLHP